MKNNEWQNALNQVRNLQDKLGCRVDKEIEETVAMLRLLGVNTTMSCGGHQGRNTNGPYVTFKHADVAKYKKICDEINNPKDKDFKAAVQEAGRLTFLEREKIWKYLEAFYKNRSTPYDQRLTIYVRPFSNELFCQGAFNTTFKRSSEQNASLLANQLEMAQFTEYLKFTYFGHK